MSNFDDYFEDQSEANQIIDEATDKLVGLISEKTKSEIERYKNWYESTAEVRDKLQKRIYEQAEQIKVLEIDLKRANEELERRDNEIPKVPFAPGDKVWYIGNDCINEVAIKCHVCEGRGKVKTHITLDAVDDVPSFIYNLVENASDLERFKTNEDRYTFSRYAIYKTKEEADKAANRETEIRKSMAEEKFSNEHN